MNTLEEFRDYFLMCNPIQNVLEHRDYGPLEADVVFRSGIFQVEKVTLNPGALIRAHRHPNIDAYEVYISGDVIFANGEPERLNGFLERVKPRKRQGLGGKSFLVKSSDWHGAKAGKSGAVFYSIQKWSGAPAIQPTAAGENWEGPRM